MPAIRTVKKIDIVSRQPRVYGMYSRWRCPIHKTSPPTYVPRTPPQKRMDPFKLAQSDTMVK
jgi:hypothetical protein